MRLPIPDRTIRGYLPAQPRGRTIVIGAGKGSAQMARALERVWEGPLEGVVVTRYGYGCDCERIEIIEAAHQVQDPAGLVAAHRLLAAVENLTGDDLVIALVSGGGSALLPAPPASLSLTDEIAVNKAFVFRRANFANEHDPQACLGDQGWAIGGAGLRFTDLAAVLSLTYRRSYMIWGHEMHFHHVRFPESEHCRPVRRDGGYSKS